MTAAPLALVAEDEPQITMIIEYILTNRGFRCVVARDGVRALELFREQKPDVVLLDVTMPRLGGLEVCRRIRVQSEVPVLLVTAHSETDDILAGFEAGADDYVSKPFDPRVLATRVDNAMRRGARPAPEQLDLAGFAIDSASRVVRVDGAQVALSTVEWRVLAALADRLDEVVSWRSLLSHAWDTEEWAGGRELVKATVYRLRQRLNRAAAHIETVRGEGYRLRSNPEERFR
jgi:two-component system response regulator MtrA